MSLDEHKTLHDYAIAKLLAHPIESLAPYDRLRIANSIGSPPRKRRHNADAASQILASDPVLIGLTKACAIADLEEAVRQCDAAGSLFAARQLEVEIATVRAN